MIMWRWKPDTRSRIDRLNPVSRLMKRISDTGLVDAIARNCAGVRSPHPSGNEPVRVRVNQNLRYDMAMVFTPRRFFYCCCRG